MSAHVARLNAANAQAEARRLIYGSTAIRRCDPWLRRMASLMQREEFAPAMLNRILGGDPQLQAVALKAVLAEETNGRSAPTSLTEAASRYGYSRVRDTIMLVGIHLCHLEMAPFGQFDAKALTIQAVAIWTAANELGDRSLTGLVANIGIGGLAAAFGSEYRHVVQSLAGGSTPLHQAEKRAFGTDHAHFGAAILREAGFNEAICYDAEHHTDSDAGSEVIAVAEVVAHQMGFDGGMANAAGDISEEALAGFGVVESSMARMAVQITNQVQWSERLIKCTEMV